MNKPGDKVISCMRVCVCTQTCKCTCILTHECVCCVRELLACCYVVAKVYEGTVYVPPCRVHDCSNYLDIINSN